MKNKLRFAIVPKVSHPWFDEVHQGAINQAKFLQTQLGVEIDVAYLPPFKADVAEQNAVLAKCAAMAPDGIAVDPVDTISNIPSIDMLRKQGIQIVLFDSPSPQDGISSIGNDFTQQGSIAALRLAKLIGESGKVAIMQGFPTAPNHKERYVAQLVVLQQYPAITVVEGGIDNDDIPTAQQQAAAVLEAHPDLKGYLCCDAAGPIGIAAAIKAAGRVDQVKVVGMDGIPPILQAIKDGILDSSSSTRPKMQGAMLVVMLWLASQGIEIPQKIDTGIDVITRENIGRFLVDS